MATAEVCRKHGVSSATFYKWKARFGGLKVSDARRLKELEDENGRLKEAGRRHARQRRAEGSFRKKVVTPAARREGKVARHNDSFDPEFRGRRGPKDQAQGRKDRQVSGESCECNSSVTG